MKATQAIAYAVALIAAVGAFVVRNSEPPRGSTASRPDDATQMRDARKVLDVVAKLQKGFYSDSARYIGDVETLALVVHNERASFPMVSWLNLTNITAQAGGWSAIATTPKFQCGMAVGMPNPVVPGLQPGQSACILKPVTVDVAPIDSTMAAIRFLRDLAAAEEAFFAESTRYSDNLRSLMLARGNPEPLWTPTAFRDPVLAATSNSWMAVVKSARYRCGIAVNRANPVSSGAHEGEPVCIKRAGK